MNTLVHLVKCKYCPYHVVRVVHKKEQPTCFNCKMAMNRRRARGEIVRVSSREQIHEKYLERLEKKAKILEARTQRALDIVEIREKEKISMYEIGKRFNLTGERVRQIVRSTLPEKGYIFKRNFLARHREHTNCSTCGAPKTILQHLFKGHGKHFCIGHRPKKTKEQLLARQRELAHIRYDKPEKRKRQSIAMKKWLVKLKKEHPERWKAKVRRDMFHQKKHQQKVRERIKTDPEFAKEIRDKNRKKYEERMQKIRSDPVLYKKFREQVKARDLRRKLKRHAATKNQRKTD